MEDDNHWMGRALELAQRGLALTSPNPMVGCVIVRDGGVVGEGFHTYDGIKHAEILALEQAGEKARGATLYVNLEPCSHTGRTGPCTEAIIAAGVKRVVAAMRDPNPQVAGRGIEQLRQAGIEVVTGAREAEARRLNESFAKHVTSGLPLVTLKSAMSLDWRIAPTPKMRDARNRWITSVASRKEVQKMRHAHDAVLTGIGTVLADDPLLTDRTGLPRRRRLLRVALDSRLRLPLKSKLVKTAKGDVLVFTSLPLDSPRAKKLQRAGVEIVRIVGKSQRMDLRAVLDELGRLNVQSVMIEAGMRVNTAAFESKSVDRVALFFAPKLLGDGAVPFVKEKNSKRRVLRRQIQSHAGSVSPEMCSKRVTIERMGLTAVHFQIVEADEIPHDLRCELTQQIGRFIDKYGSIIDTELFKDMESARKALLFPAESYNLRLRRIGEDYLVEGDLRDVYGNH